MEEMEIKVVDIDTLIPYINNAKTHPDEQIDIISASIKEFGFNNPILIDNANGIIAGHGRLLAAKKLKLEKVPTINLSHLSELQRKAYILADNRTGEVGGSDWDYDLVSMELQSLMDQDFNIDLTGFDDSFLDMDDPFAADRDADGNLASEFGVPPFSVLDARRGPWQARKKEWLAKIKDKGESRDSGGALCLPTTFKKMKNKAGVSILDPAMAEIIVKWFGCEGGKAFDPFAGDSVFGFVSAYSGMTFEGIELREAQVTLNQQRVDAENLPAIYHCDSSENMDSYIDDESVDLMFTCPPYADLEVYSDNPNDLSNMTHEQFFDVYRRILNNTFQKVKQDRFAVIVMGDVRGKRGQYIGTVSNTIQIMVDAGYDFYNEIILITPAGTLPLTSGKIMRQSRKVGRAHQHILVFVKGDSKKAATALGDIDMQVDFKTDELGEEWTQEED